MTLNFTQLAELEPELLQLETDADNREPTTVDDLVVCGNDIFYSEFKPRVLDLVGWYRKRNSGDAAKEATLRDCSSYDVVYRAIYNYMPDCRRCACLFVTYADVA